MTAAWPGSGARDAPTSRSTGAKLAKRPVFGRLYASRLHCGAGFEIANEGCTPG
jgi:hypothetical protein